MANARERFVRARIRRMRCLFAAAALSCPLAVLAQNNSEWAFRGTDGRLVYKERTDTNLGDRLPDFSMVGYGAGLRSIPNVPAVITVNPIAGDNTANIQNAINFASSLPIQPNGFRGVVQLAPGKFDVNGQININASGVVIRGSGQGDDLLTNTHIVSQNRSGSLDNALQVIRFRGSTSGKVLGSEINIIDQRVPVGAMSFNVASTSGLAVGKMIEVFRPSTQAWVDAMGMTPYWGPTERNLRWQRTVTRIEGNKVYVDAPITTAIDKHWSTGTVRTYHLPGQIHNVGIENLRGQSLDLREETNEARAWSFVEFSRVSDGFMRDVEARHFPYAAVYVRKDDGTEYITVERVASKVPSGEVTGGRRYPFAADGQMTLVQNVTSEQGRHDFVTGSNVNGPIVFFNSSTTSSRSDSGPHHRWGNGLLFDNLNVGGNEINIRNRGSSGSGHGWAGANSIVWNSTARRFAVQNPPTSQNWLIGSGPPFDDTWFGPQPRGIYDSTGARVTLGDAVNNPLDSLYIAQLLERRQYHIDQKFWTGLGGSSVWTSTSGGQGGWSNWSNKLTWNTNVSAPGPRDDVIFNLTGSSPLTTTPGANVSIASLQFDAPSAPITLALNNTTNRLTIGNRGVTVFSGIHNINGTAGGSGAISDINLADDQVWEIRGSSTLNVNARFRETIGGSLWVKEGTGTLELRANSGGSNSLKVDVRVNDGSLRITNGGALGFSGNPITISDGAALELSNIGSLAQTGSSISLAGSGRGGAGVLRHLSGSSRIGPGLGQVVLASPQTVIAADAGDLRIENPINGPGGLTKIGAGVLALTGQSSYSGGTIVKAGILGISSDASLGAASSSLTLDGGTLITTGPVTSNRVINLSAIGGRIETGSFNSSFSGGLAGTGSLIKTGSGTLDLGRVSVNTVSISDGTIAVGGAGVGSIVSTLTLSGTTGDWQSELNIGPEGFIIRSANLLEVTDQVRSGLDDIGGITSDLDDPNVRLGVIRNGFIGAPIYTTFSGITGLTGGEILLRPTVIGDLNLDNQVTIADFIDLASNFGQSNVTWQHGDINYDNQVTIADFIDLAARFGQSHAAFAAAGLTSPTAVPEPHLAGLYIGVTISLLRRRRNKNAASGCACGRYAQDRI